MSREQTRPTGKDPVDCMTCRAHRPLDNRLTIIQRSPIHTHDIRPAVLSWSHEGHTKTLCGLCIG